MQQPIQEEKYSIPIAFRKMENLHIVFWLFKDLAWCLFWKPLGLIMIVPTLLISLIILWRTRNIVSELCHNIAVSVWITANSYWMISEFFGFDEHYVFQNITYKHLSVIPFSIGIIVLVYYYLWLKPKHQHSASTL
jgi:hypothetical protein